MKKIAHARLAALGAAVVLALAACGSDDATAPSDESSTTQESTSEEPTAEDIAALEAVTVTAESGQKPVVEFEAPLTVSAPTARVISEGDGDPLEDGQRLLVHSVLFDATAGTETLSTYEDEPDQLVLGDEEIYPAINEALQGTNVGALVLFAAPPQTEDGTTNLMTIEVMGAEDVVPALERAEGTAVTPPADLPTVTLDDTGKPSIEIPEGYEAPTELVVQPLIEGDGAVVSETDTITAHYTGWLLADGTQFDSSWDRGTPSSFPLQGVIAGWTQGLAGQKVGSQVLLVIPADLAYGANPPESSTIPADADLVFVVDILGID
ncbi:MAG: FKBP-type peptidyl-prolyl cis-trans isomerase [Cellulomonadaceae bacterium]